MLVRLAEGAKTVELLQTKGQGLELGMTATAGGFGQTGGGEATLSQAGLGRDGGGVDARRESLELALQGMMLALGRGLEGTTS